MSFLGDDGGYSLHGWSGDNHHRANFRGTFDTTGASPSASDLCTFREYAGGSTTNSPYQFQQGGPNQILTVTLGATSWIKTNLGIGTQSPSYNLHVVGTMYASGSSQDYKINIKDYKLDPGLIDALRPVEYNYKEEWKHLGKNLVSGRQIGLIAEEVVKVAPDLAITVKELDKTVVRNVDYEKLTVVLLAEVQELRKRVAELERKNGL